MKTIEDRLRDAFRTDAETVRPETVRPFAPPSTPGARRSRRSLGSRVHSWQRGPHAGASRGSVIIPVAAAIAVAVIAIGITVVPRLRPGGRPPGTSHGPIRPFGSFLTVTTSQPVFSGSYLVRYPVSTLQLRSIRGGRIIAVLLRSLGTIDAVVTKAGMVLAVVDHGCRSSVFAIDPDSGRRYLIRVLPQSAENVALSPDGHELAYLTYPASNPQPCGPVGQPARPVRTQANPGGLPQFLPSVLAIVNLSSGALVSAASSNPGNPPGQPAWSPDGSMIAVVHSGEVQLVSAAHPDFATARRLSAPRGCSYVTSTWIASGLLAVVGCNPSGLSPGTLVRLSKAGAPAHTWRLPACIDGIDLRADPTASHVLLEADIGYGNNRPCGFPHPGGTSIRVAVVRPHTLDTVAVFPQGRTGLGVTGW